MRTLLAACLFVSTTTLLAACGGSPPAPATPAAEAAHAEGEHHDESHHAKHTPGANVKAPGEAKIGDTSTCPVSGEEFVVSATSPKAELDGKTYYFCCSGCESKFKKDPAKFLSKPKS